MAQSTFVIRNGVRDLRTFVDGLIDGEDPEDLYRSHLSRAPYVKKPTRADPGPASHPILFHLPIRRPHRLRTADGRTSFHFSHRTVVRLASGAIIDGLFIRPGAARAHCKYIERHAAVARLDNSHSSSADGPAAEGCSALRPYQETYDELAPYHYHLGHDPAGAFPGAGIHGTDFRLAQSEPASDRLRQMSGSHVEEAGGAPDFLLHLYPAADLDGDQSDGDRSMRGPADSASSVDGAAENLIKAGTERSRAASHLDYLERPNAIATQPDGAVAIITNIAERAEDRRKFWAAVEEEEGVPGPDRMTVNLETDRDFWFSVGDHAECPGALRAAIHASDPAARRKFEIPSGRDMRAYLAKFPGWAGAQEKKGKGLPAKPGSGQAAFHDGRGGRVQYRIIGELSSELSMAGRMQAVRRFARRFEELNMPFNLAVHAPDAGNDEDNWHFHLDYYDRPCRILTEEDIEAKRQEGFTPLGNGVGEWDFAAKFKKNGKVSRPCRQDKIKERRARDWVENLRNYFAFAVNEELRREGHVRRFDPRSYEEMGIFAEPGEHLGTKVSAAEAKGKVSDRGLANERKQWAALQRQIEERRDTGLQILTEKASNAREEARRVILTLNDSAALSRQIEERERIERLIVECEYEAAHTRELTARACSRAVYIERANKRLLEADEAGERPLSPRDRTQRNALHGAALDYLDRLQPFRQVSSGIIADCDEVRGRALAQKEDFDRQIAAQLHEAQEIERRVETWSKEVRSARPLVRKSNDGYRLSNGFNDDLARTKLGQVCLNNRYDFQEQEVNQLIDALLDQRDQLSPTEGGWAFDHEDPALRASFERLVEHPRIRSAIEKVVRQPAPAEPSPLDENRSAGASIGPQPHVSADAVPISKGASALPVFPAPAIATRDDQQARMKSMALAFSEVVAKAEAAKKVAKQQAASDAPSPQPPVSDRIALPADMPLETPMARPQAATAQRDMVVTPRLDESEQLKSAQTDQEGVEPSAHAATRNHKAFMLDSVGRWTVSAAEKTIAGFLDKNPGHVKMRGDRMGLSEKAPDVYFRIARDFDSHRIQQILRLAKASEEVAEAAQSQDVDVQTPAVPLPPRPRLTDVVPDYEMRAAAKAYHDKKRRRQAKDDAREAEAQKAAARKALERSAPAKPTPAPSPHSPSVSQPPRRPPPGWFNGGFGR